MNWRATSIVLAIVVVLLLSYLVASTRHKPQADTWSIGPGFVRTRRLLAVGNTAELLFETDEGRVYQFGVCNEGLLPVWEGMHATLHLEGCHLLYAYHLPPDAPVERRNDKQQADEDLYQHSH